MDTIRNSVKNNSVPDLHDYLHAISQDKDDYINNLGEAISLLSDLDAPREIVVSVLKHEEWLSKLDSVTTVDVNDDFVDNRHNQERLMQLVMSIVSEELQNV